MKDNNYIKIDYPPKVSILSSRLSYSFVKIDLNEFSYWRKHRGLEICIVTKDLSKIFIPVSHEAGYQSFYVERDSLYLIYFSNERQVNDTNPLVETSYSLLNTKNNENNR